MKGEDIEYKIKKHKIIYKLNINLKRGKIHCLYGPNGCGKSTLMKILSL